MIKKDTVQFEFQQFDESDFKSEYDLERIIFDLDSQIDLLSSHTDKIDYLVSIGSGVLCGLVDIFWVGSFDLERGRNIASNEIEDFIVKIAKIFNYKSDNLEGAVRFLEKKFPIPSDGNTPDFGGGLQHHLRDFAHHPTLIGLFFSLFTQFTYKSFGTDKNGKFIIVDVNDGSREFIGNDISSKVIFGTITWFFHLVSDIAGSSSSAGKSGGTGIPGPILSLAKELATLPIFKNINIGDNTLSVFLSKLFNGTLLAKHDENGKLIRETVLKFDMRTEIGIGVELGRQSVPIVANECLVRIFYFIRRLATEMCDQNIQSITDMKKINWDNVKPFNNPTIARMITIATAVFTTADIGEAIATKKYWLSINFIGVGRFSIALSDDVSWYLQNRSIKKVKKFYADVQRFAYVQTDEKIYVRMSDDMNNEKIGLTIEQTEILYNLEYYKTLNDIKHTKLLINKEKITELKQEWLDEWKSYITMGFSSFLQIENVELHWYTEQELIQKVNENEPSKTWFRLVLLEAMLFEPYYSLSLEKDSKGKDIPSKKYKTLQSINNGYKKRISDDFLDSFFTGNYYEKSYVKRLRKCYNKVLFEMQEVMKGVLLGTVITAGIAILVIATAGALAPSIAVVLVGSNFTGLGGAALTSACLAYLGGGAVAIGGAGMAGGTIAIVGGGAILGIGAGMGIGGAVGAAGILGKQNTILQSAKLLVSVREIFLNDEHDLEYSNSVYEQYVKSILDIEKGIVELRLQADVVNGKEKKDLKEKIRKAEESVEAMKIARKNLLKFMSSFEEGVAHS